MGSLSLLLGLVLLASLSSCTSGFATSLSFLPCLRSAAAARTSSLPGVSMQAETKWNFGRFAQTFTRFNGIPFLGPLGKAATVPQPAPAVKGRDAVLWGFAGMTKAEFEGMWAPLDDVVMGGVSVSDITRTESGDAVLRGATSSRNNGGFCSARTSNLAQPYDLTGYQGVAMTAKSSVGMRYKLILRDREGWDTVAWCKSFDLPAGQSKDIKVKFSDFLPVFRGSTAKGQAPIDPSSIYSVQVMVSKYEYDGALNPNFTEGPFELQFGSIRAFK